VFELDRVTYTYPGGARPALSDVSVQIAPGELVVLAGASGSGKSTLLHTASGLVPHFHGGTFSGRAVIAGMDNRDHGPGELAARVGTLFQDPETQVVMGTVRGELALPLENRGEPPSAVARGVEEAALALGIAHLLERPTASLSGGELQRVALGAALVGRPSLIVLDEPTSQLDPVAGDELLAILRRLNEDSEAAIVIAEHRLERCLAWADRVIALHDGCVVCDEAPTQFLEWSLAAAPELSTPGARLLAGIGLPPAAGVKAARAALRRRGVLPDAPRGVLTDGPRGVLPDERRGVLPNERRGVLPDLDDPRAAYRPFDRPGPKRREGGAWSAARVGPGRPRGWARGRPRRWGVAGPTKGATIPAPRQGPTSQA
jgi:energy-coupling factor transport system ATP-binding protein